jgi:hypothetical protein
MRPAAYASTMKSCSSLHGQAGKLLELHCKLSVIAGFHLMKKTLKNVPDLLLLSVKEDLSAPETLVIDANFHLISGTSSCSPVSCIQQSFLFV